MNYKRDERANIYLNIFRKTNSKGYREKCAL